LFHLRARALTRAVLPRVIERLLSAPNVTFGTCVIQPKGCVSNHDIAFTRLLQLCAHYAYRELASTPTMPKDDKTYSLSKRVVVSYGNSMFSSRLAPSTVPKASTKRKTLNKTASQIYTEEARHSAQISCKFQLSYLTFTFLNHICSP